MESKIFFILPGLKDDKFLLEIIKRVLEAVNDFRSTFTFGL